ncbi:hypothetical protein [Uliginosibacterium gangwonense]|uniref:hypothetical protein n=1 Tax=Uliginosibacterium gangwonense TaxID=392736 RepID=UPI0003634DDE|nr:hypothetical protein [Uliginosibacterium gangwonense]
MITPRKYRCPTCGEKAGVEIVYGMPGADLAEAAQRGEVVLGGCSINLEGPERQCTLCGHAWRIRRRGPTLSEGLL